MSIFRNRIAFIIPTRNRPRLLTDLLASLQAQTVPADQIVIVDGSDQPIEPEIKQFLLPYVYYQWVSAPSLTKQRNEGIRLLKDDITLVGYLDDDIIMEKDAVEAMLHFWEHSPNDIGGSSFNITNNPPSSVSLLGKLFLRVFCFGNGRKGKILRSGFNTPVAPVSEDTYVDWLPGGATVWHRKILEEFKYDEWYEGWAYVEDVDFSFSVSKRYKLVVLQSAKVQHLPPPYSLSKSRSLGRTLVKQQYHFVSKHPELSTPLFLWSNCGQIINSLLFGILRRQRQPILIASGTIAGLFDILRKNFAQTDEAYRVK